MSEISGLVLHESSRRLIGTYLARPSHALLLSGPDGVGLATVAHSLAKKLGESTHIQDIVPDEKGTIPIETVRGLYRLTRTQRDTALVIIIDDADAMGIEAQNALLKLLEEPNDQIYFILTSHVPQSLLATILSRLQRIELLPVSETETEGLIAAGTTPEVRAQLRFLAGGLPAELARLQESEPYLQQRIKQMRDAKKFLESDMYERLLLAYEYSADRKIAQALLGSLNRLLVFMLLERQQPSLVNSLECIEQTRDRLSQNAHVKTQLLYLVTRFHSVRPSGTIGN